MTPKRGAIPIGTRAPDSSRDTVEIEGKLTALLDSYCHGLEARRFCKTDADREFTKLVMDDLEKQIAILRTKLEATDAPV